MRSLTLVLCFAFALIAPARAAQTHITFVTDWKAQAEHGGFYEALAEGLYAKRGLDVAIRQGGPQVNVPELLAGGAADFGIGSNSFIVLNLVKEHVPLRAIMAVFQKDPQVLISHPRRDLNSLSEMRGDPIMISDASMTSFWPWLKARWHFSDSQIRKYTFNLAPFLVNPNAIQEGYLTSEPFTIESQGHFKPKVFLLADYG
ncbi:MAG: ABC transporter substrate-binding protein, partial [Rhizomicrobium sp.]